MNNQNYKRKIKPKKSIGQHFLTNESIAEQIADTVSDLGLPVLEIGPGTGALTKYLYRRFGDRLYLCEIDQRSIRVLKNEYPKLSSHILQEDFLKVNLPKEFPRGVSITGNYPYNISSQIVFNVLDNYELIPELTGMFQKEVAERITAEPGNKQYGQLTVICNLYYDSEYLFTVDKQEFDPPPKVQSGVIRMSRRPEIPDVDQKKFKQLVKQSFSQRRKKLRNNLKSFFSQEFLSDNLFDLRPEQLSLQQYIDLTNQIEIQ